MNIPDEAVLRKYQMAKRAITESTEWRKHAEHLKTVNRFIAGDQRPAALDQSKGEMWFSVPIAVNYAIRTAASLGGGRVRCFLDPKGAGDQKLNNEMLHQPALDMFLREQDELMLAARYNRFLFDIAAKGNGAILLYADSTRDPDVGPMPNMMKLDPGQFGFMPTANDPFHPTLGSPVVWYDTLVPLPTIFAAFPHKYNELRKMKTYGLGDNFIADDVRDPLYSLFQQLRSEGSGPLSLYEHMSFGQLAGQDEDKGPTRLLRRSHFFWEDVVRTPSGNIEKKWFEADIVEPDGSLDGGSKHSVVLSWHQCQTPNPRIVLGSAWNNGNSPFGRGVYGLAGNIFALIDASVTLTYRQLTAAAQLNDMLLVDGDAIKDPKVTAILESGDRESLIKLTNLRNRSWRDVIGRIEASAPNLSETRAFISMLLDLADEVLGQPPVTRGQKNTPGERISGPVIAALQSAASLNLSPLAFIASAALTNIGRAHWAMMQRLLLSEYRIPRVGPHGGWTMNKQIPLERASELRKMPNDPIPTYEGEYAVPNGVRTYIPGDDGNMKLDRQMPFSHDVIDAALNRPDRPGINIVFNDVSQMKYSVRIIPESEYQQDLNEFMQRLAIFEQYRSGQMSTETIGKKMFEQFGIDIVEELKARYGEAVVEKISKLDEASLAQVDGMIDMVLQQSLAAKSGGGPAPANVAASVAPTA